jgi:heptosyltransferase-2
VTGKTIVYLPNWLGDMVMATPLLHSLRASIEGELWAIGKNKALQVYNGNNLFDRFISYNDKGFIPFLDTVNSIRALGFERGVIIPHSFRSALLFFTGNVRNRIGYSRNHRGFMLTSRIDETVTPEPTVEHYLKIIDFMGGRRIIESPVLTVTEDEENMFDEKYMDMRSPYVVFITGAQYGPSKRWPDSYFSELADRIVSKLNMNVNLLPGFGEEGLARKICQTVEHKERVAIKSMDIRELKVCLSRATAVVSNDTGPRHISAALSVPTVVLLGPMDEQYTLYPSPCTYVFSKDVECRPCNKKRCDRNHACLTSITPDEVFKKLEEIFEARPNKTH